MSAMRGRVLTSETCNSGTVEVILALTKSEVELLAEAIGFADSESCWFVDKEGSKEDVDRKYLYDTIVKQRWLSTKTPRTY